MSRIKVVGLSVFPVKSMQGEPHQEVRVTERGLEHDRRFMLIDPEGRFITQRECARLATCQAHISSHNPNCLLINYGDEGMNVGLGGVKLWNEGDRIPVTVWSDTVEATAIAWADLRLSGESVNASLSRWLDRPVRLVHIPDSSLRPSRGQREDAERVLNGFADGFPFLITSVESLADLNDKIGDDSPIGMDRFRANIVVSGCSEAFEEEAWREFRIGGITFYGMKRCGRCIITTTDQKTGERMGKEPLKTLARYRRFGKDACFGMNLNHRGTGIIRVGDEVEIIERGPPFIES